MSTTSSIGSPLAADERGFEAGHQVVRPPRRLLLDVLQRLLADVGREVPHVVGHGGRGVDADVDDDIGSEGLAQLDRGRDAGRVAGIVRERRVLHVLGTDAEDDDAAGEAAEGRPRREERLRKGQAEAAELHRQPRPVGDERGVEEVHRR